MSNVWWTPFHMKQNDYVMSIAIAIYNVYLEFVYFLFIFYGPLSVVYFCKGESQ